MLVYADPDHKIEYTKETIKEELEKNGFDVISTGIIVYDTPLAGIIDLTGAFSLRIYKRLSIWKRRMVTLKPNDSTGFRVLAKPIKHK